MGTDGAHYIVLTTTLPPPRLSFTRWFYFYFFHVQKLCRTKGWNTSQWMILWLKSPLKDEVWSYCYSVWACVTLCVFVWGGGGGRGLVGCVLIFNTSSVMMVSVCVCLYGCECVCVCVCADKAQLTSLNNFYLAFFQFLENLLCRPTCVTHLDVS